MSIGPVQRRAIAIQIPEVNLRDADIAEAIADLVEYVNRPSPPPVEIGIVKELDGDEKRRRQEFSELFEWCKGRRITFACKDCNILDVLAHLANAVDLRTDFRQDQLIVVTRQGQVLAK